MRIFVSVDFWPDTTATYLRLCKSAVDNTKNSLMFSRLACFSIVSLAFQSCSYTRTKLEAIQLSWCSCNSQWCKKYKITVNNCKRGYFEKSEIAQTRSVTYGGHHSWDRLTMNNLWNQPIKRQAKNIAVWESKYCTSIPSPVTTIT